MHELRPRRGTAGVASRLGAALAVMVLAVLLPADVASAHVTAQPGNAEAGGYAVVTFRVPNESDTAATVKVSVTLPDAHPLSSVRTTEVPGWTAEVTMKTLDEPIDSHGQDITEVADTVTWTASADAGIAPGAYRDFPLSLGPMPEGVDVRCFPTTQTYDDGEIANWDQEPTGDAEPERPAPAVSLSNAEGTSHHAGGEGAAAAESSSDPLARWLAVGGLVLGGLAAGLAFGAMRKRHA